MLKDASATAIYGSRGANGVVIISTKKGAAGRPQIEYNANVTISSMAKKQELLTGYQMCIRDRFGMTPSEYRSMETTT